MARRFTDYSSPPATLDHHIFYGLTLDEGQKKLRDAIWDEGKRIVFCNAKAGTGKTTIAIATAVMMVRYGLYDDIVYVVHSVGDAQGFLPGTISEKSSVLFEPLYQALITANEDPMRCINTESLALQKSGESFVTAITDTYLRGGNIGPWKRTICILDETQNMPENILRKVGTRACENTKVICLGHDLQCDLHDPAMSGFTKCMRHFEAKKDPRFAFCTLAENHRGYISGVFDESWIE